MADVRAALRRAYEDRDDTRRRGLQAAEEACQFTWARTAQLMTDRICAVAKGQNGQAAGPGVTACLLTQNAERSLAECLAHLRPFVEQVLVLDSNSQGRTAEVSVAFMPPLRPGDGSWRYRFD